MDTSFLQRSLQQFDHYRTLAEKTIDKISNDGLIWQYNQETNSIAVIMKHMSGNMISRWTDIFHSDGEKPWRDRDEEFVNEIKSREELMEVWNRAWSTLFKTIGELQEADLGRTIYIRAEAHTVTEAIIRNLAHCSYHVGQIVHIGKMLLDAEWESLTIPRNASVQFNQAMQEKGKQ